MRGDCASAYARTMVRPHGAYAFEGQLVAVMLRRTNTSDGTWYEVAIRQDNGGAPLMEVRTPAPSAVLVPILGEHDTEALVHEADAMAAAGSDRWTAAYNRSERGQQTVAFPNRWDEVVDALEELTDPTLQSKWGTVDAQDGSYVDFAGVVHALYDDNPVLPDPEGFVGIGINAREVDALQRLGALLGPIIDEHGGDGHEAVRDPRWPSVISTASEVLALMTGDAAG